MKKKLILYTISIIVTAAFFVDSILLHGYFLRVSWIVSVIMISILLSAIMAMAGYHVLKIFFLSAAELSLLIFLAQVYCSVSRRSPTNDAALQILLTMGFLYITISFFRSLYNSLKEYYKKIANEKWSVEKIFAVVSFLSFTAFFIWQIYLALTPIILNFCVYRQ